MSFFFSGYSALRGDKGVEQTGAETVHKLCDRVQNSTLLEDRRAAVMGLKGLAKDWRLDVGTKGMPVLINVLRNDRMDVDIVKAAMETLQILCARDPPKSAGSPPGGNGGEDLGLMFTEIYTKDAGNVTLLLDILEEVDFYVRFYAVQLLNTLLENVGNRLQDSVLTSPLGISRLIDLLDDRREIIRNEGLLLLIALTENNADIQKIIAFESAFERLLGIIVDEGATDGGIIVQDCLQLTHNLLKYNVSNQNLFRETSCIQRIPSLLTMRLMLDDRSEPVDVPLTHDSIVWTDQKVVNAVLVLEIVRILAAPKNPSAAVNQNVMNYAKIIGTLSELAFSTTVPVKVKAQALFAYGDAVRGHKANQDIVSRTTLSASFLAKIPNPRNTAPIPAVLQLIRLALNVGEFPVRAAAAYAFESYVYHNPDAQLAVLSTLIPPPSENPNSFDAEKPESAGSLLVSSILEWTSSRKEPFGPWFAATLLSHAMHDNTQGQHLAISTKLDEGEDAVSLLHKCMFALLYASREAADVRISLGILCLLSIWVHECPKAVAEMLTEGSNIQFLVEQINQSSGVDPLIQGVAAYLLGLLYEYNDDSEPTFTRTNLQALVTSRIGADVFASRIERLREAKEFNGASQHIIKKETNVGADGLPEVYFDFLFVELFKSNHDRIVRDITTPVSKGSSPKRRMAPVDEATLTTYQSTIATQTTELTTLREKILTLEEKVFNAEQIESEVVVLRAQVAAMDVQRGEQTNAHQQQLEALYATIKALEQEMADQSAATGSGNGGAEQELAAKNQRIAELEKALAEQTQKNAQLVNAGQNSAAQEREIDSLQQTVQRLERALVEQSHKQTQAPPGQPQPTPDITALQQRIETLEQALEAEHQKYATLETDHEDLLVYMADQDEIMEGLKAQMEALRVQSAQPEHDTSTRETSPQRQPTAEFQQQQQAYYPHEQQAPVVSTDVPEGPNRIYVGELPTFLNEEPVMELLQTFGYLKAFTLIKDNFTGVSTGVAYCEYADPTTTDVACQGLNGMEIAGGKLVVRRADETSVGSDQLAAPQGGYEGPAYATDGQGYDGKVYDANVHSHAHTGHDHGHNHTGHDHHHHHHHHHQAPPPTSGYPNYPTYNYTTQAPSNQTHSPTHTYLATHPYTSPSTPPVHSQQHTYNNAHTQEGYNNGMVQHHQRQHQGQGHGHTSQHGDVTTAEHQQPHPFAKTDTASLFGESAGSFL